MPEVRAFGPRQVEFGPFRLDFDRRILFREGKPVRLGSRARDILIFLVERAGEVVTKGELFSHVWPDAVVEDGALRVHISAIRRALEEGGPGGRYIENVTGRGYRFAAHVIPHGGAEPAPDNQSFQGFDARMGFSERGVQLPPPLASMVGRDEDVKEISGQLVNDRFVTIAGAGGIGKTTVAVRVAHSLLAEFAGRAVFVGLDSVSDRSHVAGTFASALGLATPNTDLLPGMVTFLRAHRTLLVIDSCEHLIDEVAELISRIFRETANTHILATSREPLRAEGEHLYLLPPLRIPADAAGLSASEALQYPAVQLFMQRARAGGHRVELTDSDAPIVAAVCRKLDGVALAIELAASRVSSLGIRGVADLLDSRLKFLWRAYRTVPLRHRTLEALLDWSYDLLNETEQRSLRRLSILVGSFTLDAARSVVADSDDDALEVVDTIANLVDRSLVAVTPDTNPVRYRLLETTREYGLAKLLRDGDANPVASRHAHYFASLLRSEEMQLPRAIVARDLGNVRAALEWSFEQGEHELGIELALGACPLLLRLSQLGECRHWSRRALAILPESARGSAREMELLESLAVSTMFTRGNGEEVLGAVQRGFEIARALGNDSRATDFLIGLHMFYSRIGDFTAALDVANRAADLARASADRGRIVVSEWMMGVGHHLLGDQAQAQAHLDTGFAEEVEPERRYDLFGFHQRIRALVALARTLWLRGFAEQAKSAAHRAIDAAKELAQPIDVSVALIYTAEVFLWSGDLETADQIIQQLLIQAQQHSLEPYHAVGVGLLGELRLARGEDDAGIQLLSRVAQMLDAEQHLIQAPAFAAQLAQGLAVQGHRDRALVVIEAAAAQRERGGASFDMPEILRIWGQILLAEDRDDPLGHQQLDRAFALAQLQHSSAWALRTAMTQVEVRPEHEGSRALLSQVYADFSEGFDTPDLRKARRLLEKT